MIAKSSIGRPLAERGALERRHDDQLRCCPEESGSGSSGLSIVVPNPNERRDIAENFMPLMVLVEHIVI